MYKGEDKVVELLSKNKKMSVKEISEQTGMNEDSVRRIIESLKSLGSVETELHESITAIPNKEFEEYHTGGFPELSVFKKALNKLQVKDLSSDERSIGLRWAKVKGFVQIEEGKLIPSKSEEDVSASMQKLKVVYEDLKQSGTTTDVVALDELYKRHLLEKKTEKTIHVKFIGVKSSSSGFNVNVPSADAPIGKSHPITKMSHKIKSIMAELGFQEMEGSILESSFWNFDALFQPQDHPARELADTFYLNHKSPLPNKELVSRIKKAHEEGWKYKWDPKEAEKSVLRTHTTCLSARNLAALKDKKPKKFFAIGKVFRNEATDYSHLAEFHQVEGIIAWENAKFTDLLGILKEFYRKLGFEKIRFRPSFFPYTEPSLEIEVYFEEKKQWLELGGAGIFRPEVSIPLAGVYPVLAWGLSLERPLMLALELDDIRTFYKNDADFLISARLDV
ncbi:phenylalanine--tRNA ligase subunit alpha [Candidatus Micrarchaeota archaeon]|nr:phenylalanine--tRNA ligase subunit alpha [Candidatus Micrarchaeota archaeon]MBU1681386.1 phenylalanine--tRNA ligase subunit alpha [Candidatus Micrarchaeota archaeon]